MGVCVRCVCQLGAVAVNSPIYVTAQHACVRTPYVSLSFGVFVCMMRRFYHNPTGDVNSSRRFVCTGAAAFVTNIVVICQI